MTNFFTENSTIYKGIASGRMDVMGGIADYSGSRVLQKSINETTTIELVLRSDKYFRLLSKAEGVVFPEINININELISEQEQQQKTQIDLSTIRQKLKKVEGGEWAGYVLGCFILLFLDEKIPLEGADIYVSSEVPVGKGVSSSAALEVATLKAIQTAYQLDFQGTALPILAQRVENLIVGAPCGLMDQLASYFGNPRKLLPIDCRPDILHPLIDIPSDLYFWGIDSGVRHSVEGASYSDVRTAAFMGYSIIAQAKGVSKAQIEYAKQHNDRSKLPYAGYLANITPSDFEYNFRKILPINIKGSEFIAKYGTTIDTVTTIQPNTVYDVLACTLHPIMENFRVVLFGQLLQSLSNTVLNAAERKAIFVSLGELMYQAHESYTMCKVGNIHTDEIVQLAKKYGADNGIYGAKITGGGSGGTVCILADTQKGSQTIKLIFEEYKSKIGLDIKLFE